MRNSRQQFQSGDSGRDEPEATVGTANVGQTPTPPTGRIPVGLTGLARRRQVLVFGALGLVVIVAAAAVLVPLSMPHATGTSPEPSAVAQVSQSATPSDSPTPSITPAPTTTSYTPEATITPAPEETPDPEQSYPPNLPPTPHGWPVNWTLYSNVDFQAGPDGTIYMTEWNQGWSMAVDATGNTRSGWLRLADGRTLSPLAFGPDGTILAVDPNSAGENLVYAFDADGTLRSGWPQAVGDPDPESIDPLAWHEAILPGPQGTLYTTRDGNLVILGSDGAVRATSSGAAARIDFHSAFVRPDGTFFTLAYVQGPDGRQGREARVSVYDSSARKLSSDAAPYWDQNSMAMGPDGTVVVWARTLGPTNETPRGKDITLAIIDTSGRPLPGWPVTVAGTVSNPVVDAEGTIYLTVDRYPSQPARIVALLQTGKAKPGWPYDLPQGMRGCAAWGGMGTPYYPASPIIGRAGTVYQVTSKVDGELYDTQAVQDTVVAVGGDGQPLSGWPAKLPEAVAGGLYLTVEGVDLEASDYTDPLFVTSPSGTGQLYLYGRSRIMVLGEDGQMAAGWPKNGRFEFWAPMPDGGLSALLVTMTESDWPKATLYRWLPDGSPAK